MARDASFCMFELLRRTSPKVVLLVRFGLAGKEMLFWSTPQALG